MQYLKALHLNNLDYFTVVCKDSNIDAYARNRSWTRRSGSTSFTRINSDLLAAKLGAIIAEKLGQPSVLGELGAGIVVGNLTLANIPYLEFLKHDHSLEIFAGIGVIILLFEVALKPVLRRWSLLASNPWLLP